MFCLIINYRENDSQLFRPFSREERWYNDKKTGPVTMYLTVFKQNSLLSHFQLAECFDVM